MPFEHEASDWLRDVISNSRQIAEYIRGLDRASFEADQLRRDAVERCLERICEAVHRLGDRRELLMPGQPWADIRGMGNRLRHAYDRLDVHLIWSTVTWDLPQLAGAAVAALDGIGQT